MLPLPPPLPLPFHFFIAQFISVDRSSESRAHKSSNKSARFERSKWMIVTGHLGEEEGNASPPMRGSLAWIQPKSNALPHRIDAFSSFSVELVCGPPATILTRFVYRRGRGGRGRFHRYFKGNSEGKGFGNEQSRRLNLDVSFDRSWRESKDGFWRRMQQETLVTTSVLHKYFNRRLFHVLPIPCDFR